ncbi:MAG TPA: glycoside hydrolase family 15 protein [Actinomycetes bacterium]|nr:glycoside hydrolase family 15 protein [Actinomycetes bacterium]
MASQVTVGRRPRQGARPRLRNGLGLYAEEYDVTRGRQVGNFPQAFTHLALIEAARVLSGERVGTRSTTPAPLPRLPAPPRRPAPATLRRP